MNAFEYVKKFRRIGVTSMLVAGAVAAALVGLGSVPFHEWVLILALAIGLLPVLLFHIKNKPVCESCGGRMRLKSGYPNLVYQCQECRGEVDTGMHSDY
jgi:hypothetical protein